MGYQDASFLDTKEEHDEWHKGIYTGLKVYDPRKLHEAVKYNEKGWREWYRNDNHYHDVPMLAAYGLKGAATFTGVLGLIATGLL